VSVLFVTATLDYSGAARRLLLLARSRPAGTSSVRVAVLGPSSPWAEALPAAVAVDVLGWRRPFDLRPLLALHRLARSFAPTIVHAWGPSALRAAALAAGGPGRLFASAVLPPVGRPSWPDRWLLRHARQVVAFGTAEQEHYRRLGVAPDRLALLPLATDLPPAAPAPAEGLPPGARVILAVGPLHAHKGFREAVWTFDILSQVYPDLHLVIAGTGPDQARVQAFARSAGVAGRTHFLGPCAELAGWLARAEVVWVPSLRRGGRQTALEAQAAGRAVVASRLPELTEVVADGVTGLLVEPDDKAALARSTRALLDDPALARRLGEAGRRHVAERFSVARLAEQAARLYASR
jgi:glycosyltransferase involved in cell wall biosynthesis